MEEWIEFDEPSAQRAVAALGRALPWIDLAVAACALVSIILTAFFGFDLGLSGLGVLVKIAAVLTTLAAPLWFLGRALQLLIARQSSRRSAFARAIGAVAVIALNAAMLRSDLPAKSFVWRRMDEFEAIVRGEKDTAKSAYGVTRYKGRIVIRYPMWDNWLDTFNVVYDPYRLTEAQYSAVLAGIRCLGEDEFFISHTERARGAFDPRESGEHIDDWSCQLPTYAEYVSTPVFLENALYSASGAWGVLLSHEEHAVLGGTAAFVGAVKESYHGWRDDLRRLAEFWRANPHGDWIEAFVARCGRTDT